MAFWAYYFSASLPGAKKRARRLRRKNRGKNIKANRRRRFIKKFNRKMRDMGHARQYMICARALREAGIPFGAPFKLLYHSEENRFEAVVPTPPKVCGEVQWEDPEDV